MDDGVIGEGCGNAVVEHSASECERRPADGARHFTTNCFFGGADLHTLFVTDAGHGTVLAFESMPTPGHPLTPFRPAWPTGIIA
jgi:hypothetical protein